MKKNLVIMNFSHIYENEKFFCNEDYKWIDCTNINGTNGYCDNEAFNALEEKVQALGAEGIHFIDSGNYHYVSELWINKIKKDFTLVVFDHHSDMMKPAFGDILSCGSWVMDELEKNPYLKKVILIGVSKEQKETIQSKYLDKIACITDEDLLNEETLRKININKDKLPIYISIDKDVLNKDIVNTSWDQGTMTFDELKYILEIFIKNKEIIGLDICGENEISKVEDIKNNDDINGRLLKFLYEQG